MIYVVYKIEYQPPGSTSHSSVLCAPPTARSMPFPSRVELGGVHEDVGSVWVAKVVHRESGDFASEWHECAENAVQAAVALACLLGVVR